MDLVQIQAEDVKNMFLGEAPDSHDAKLAYDLFWLMMDWDSRNALGVAPLKERIDEIEAISSVDELMSCARNSGSMRRCIPCRFLLAQPSIWTELLR